MHRCSSLIGLVLTAFACVRCVSADGADDLNAYDVEQVQTLEQRLFERTLTDEQLMGILGGLRHSESQSAAAAQIMRSGVGCQAQITEFANSCPDIELRERCADIISQLDDAWRESADGRLFIDLCRKNCESLLPEAWKRFSADGKDQAAGAMILAAPADMVWKWIEDKQSAKSGGTAVRSGSRQRETQIEIDRGRYLLLRIRDLSPDAFAASHIPEVPNLMRQTSHVFGGLSYRMAGHVHLKHLTPAMVTTHVAGGFQSQTAYHFHSKRYLLFQFEDQVGGTSIRLGQWVAFDTVTYGPYIRDRQFRITPLAAEQKAVPYLTSDTAFVRESSQSHTSSRLVPLLHLKPEHRDTRSLPDRFAPWWWKRYVSGPNAQRMAFTGRRPGATAPAEQSEEPLLGLAPTGRSRTVVSPRDDALSFVILPPRLLGPASEPHLVAAELACDRLAEELEVLAIQVVDRQHLQTLLDERSLGTISSGALTGFDAMVRLEVSNDRLQPESTVSVVDLSTGTTLATHNFAWPIPESDAEQIRTLLKTAVSSAAHPGSKRLKIRFNGTRQPPQIRMRPFATKLTQAVEQALRNDRRVIVVDHLEAGSAAEESLLILMGLSRLPGGRTFQPTADVVLGLTLREHDSAGKSFDDTTLEAGYTLKVQQADPFVAVTARVAEFDDHLVPKVIESVNQRLTNIQPGTTIEDDAFALRQAQAAQELMAIGSIDPGMSRVDQALARRHHAESALKLDPTSLHAVFELILGYQQYIQADRNAVDSRSISLQGLTLVADRMEEFAPHPNTMPQMLNAANAFAFALNLHSLRHQAQFDQAKSQEYSRITTAALRIAEAGLTRAPSDISGIIGNFLEPGFAGLKASGTELSVIQSRLDTIIDQLERLQSEYAEAIASQFGTPSVEDKMYQRRILTDLRHIRGCAFSVSCSMQLPEQFDRLMPAVQRDLSNGMYSESVAQILLSDIKRLDNAPRTAEFEAWLKERGDQPVVSLISPAWPAIDVFADLPITAVDVQSHRVRDVAAGQSVCPLARTSDRLYFLIGESPFIGWKAMAGSGTTRRPNEKFGFVPLDQRGQPAGDVRFLALPDSMANKMIRCCVSCDDRLILGTTVVTANEEGGMYVLDPAENTWTHWGVEQGLPARMISSMHLLSDKRILCTGMAGFAEYACFTVEPSSGEIRHFASGRTSQQQSMPNRLMGIYANGDTICGYSKHGCWRNLLSAEPFRQSPQYSDELNLTDRTLKNADYFGDIRDACQIKDYLFFVNDTGLHKADLSGVVKRIWGSKSAFPASFETDLTSNRIALPRSPAQTGSYLVNCGELLVMITPESESLVAFDPEHDLWYGPVRIPRSVYAIVDQQKVWLGGNSLYQLSVSDIKAAAKNCGRIMTTEEYETRQRRKIDKTTGLKRAKLELASGHFESARSCLEQLRLDGPQDFEPHYLSGMMYDTSILNQPEQAAAAYLRAAESAKSPSEAFSSHYRHCLLLLKVGRTQEAAEQAETILTLYPRMESSRLKDRILKLTQQPN